MLPAEKQGQSRIWLMQLIRVATELMNTLDWSKGKKALGNLFFLSSFLA